MFLKEYVDLSSDDRIQQYDESYCGAYLLNMIYLIDNGYRRESALITLVNQVKFPESYDECLGFKIKGKLGVEFGDNVNVNDQGFQPQPMADVNDNVNANDNVNDYINDNVIDNDKGKNKANDNANGKANNNGNNSGKGNVNTMVYSKQESPLSDEDDDGDYGDIIFSRTKQSN